MSRKGKVISPLSGRVPITLDKERFVVFNFNALATLEEQTGESTLSEAFWKKMLTPPKASNIRLLLWAGLLEDDPAITLQDVGRLVSPDNFAAIFATIMRAQNAQADQPTKDEMRPFAESGAAEAATV